MAKISNASQTSLFLLFIVEERTNMATPWGGQTRSKKVLLLDKFGCNHQMKHADGNTGTFPTFSWQPASLICFPVSEEAILLVLAVCFVTRGFHWMVTIYINAQQGLDAKSITQTMGWGGRKTHVMATCLQPVQTIYFLPQQCVVWVTTIKISQS